MKYAVITLAMRFRDIAVYGNIGNAVQFPHAPWQRDCFFTVCPIAEIFNLSPSHTLLLYFEVVSANRAIL